MANAVDVVLKVQSRSVGKPRQIRRDGLVPAVIYGQGNDSEHIAVDYIQAVKMLGGAGARGIINLELEDASRTVMVKDIQRDPVKGEVLHLDFYTISLTDKIQTMVPVRLTGDDDIPRGAVLQHQLYEVQVECFPGDIPSVLEIDVSHLEVGDSVVVGDLKADDKIEVLSDPGQVIASLLVSRTEDEAEEADAEVLEPGADEPAEPEVIGADEDAQEADEDDEKNTSAS